MPDSAYNRDLQTPSEQQREDAPQAGRFRPGAWKRLARISRRALAGPAARAATIAVLAALLAGTTAFTWYYVKFAREVDARLRAGAFAHTVNIYTAPQTIAAGDEMTPEQLVARLRMAGYRTSRTHPKGWFNVRPDHAVEIFPGPKSYFDREQAGVIHFANGKIARIISLDDNTERRQIQVEPVLITNVSAGNREKRRPVSFAEIPPVVIQALTSAEDKHFFRHSGVDFFRILKAAYVDLREMRKEQGASTLSMQLARSLWLHPDKSFRRKAQELLIALHLEARLSKEQIFEHYCNQVYLGRRGTFSINGFGEGAWAYFGKDVGKLTLMEAATLAGIVQRPSWFNPFRYPERVRERRNLVLALMRQNGHLSEAEYRNAAASPLTLSPPGVEGIGDVRAQYFVDRVNDQLQGGLRDGDRVDSVYTTLDAELQRAAVDAVEAGMKTVDKLVRARSPKGEQLPPNQPQVALVALDPKTGEVKAMVGGRNYSESQFDHVLARRPPGSVFKPFVFAAALNTAVEGGNKIFTPASTVVDEPTVFQFANEVYEPNNYGGRFLGRVTLRRALAASLNVATVRLAEAVGYERVLEVARRAGLPGNLQPTPAIALGAYDATPLEIAGAYTVFANEGLRTSPTLISMVRSPDGVVVYRHVPEPRRALDPRVAYLMVNMMQDVIARGTGAGVRGQGFLPPAAGKTGTSHDSWFAGFTSELLCVVWVGFDDYRDMKLEGSKAALPVWTEFMKKAHMLRAYRETKPFKAPPGVVTARICSSSGQQASAYCDSTRNEVFIDGSQPVVVCNRHNFVTHYLRQQRYEEELAAQAAAQQAEGPVTADRAIVVLPAQPARQ